MKPRCWHRYQARQQISLCRICPGSLELRGPLTRFLSRFWPFEAPRTPIVLACALRALLGALRAWRSGARAGWKEPRPDNAVMARRHVGPNLVQKTVSLAIALTAGRRVSDERVRRRVEICSRCRYVRVRKTRRRDRRLNCGICGCRLRGRHALINLVRYEETRRWGCKHPGGSRWKKAGV